MPSKRSLTRRLAIGLSSLALALAAGELFVRWRSPRQPPLRLEQFSNAIHEGFDVRFREVFESDPELVWRLGRDLRLAPDAWPLPGLVSNSQGLRETKVIPLAPKEDLRILFVGDSCTFGYQLPWQESFVQLTEIGLSERFAPATIECINAGVPGYSLFQGWRFLETEGLDFEPDLVVLNFGWNGSTRWDGLSDAQHHAAWVRAQPPPGLRWSRLAQRLWEAGADRRAGPVQEPRARLLPEEFEDLLQRCDRLCAQRGTELLLLIGAGRFNLTQPFERRNAFQAAQLSFARSRAYLTGGAPALLDTVPILQDLGQEHAADELFFDEVHTTALANRAIASALVSKLAPWVAQELEEKRGETE